MIKYEKEIIEWLNLPSIPKKKWDGKMGFRDGVAVIKHNDEQESYAVATFNPECDSEPRIKKVFGLEPFHAIGDIFVVPSYMNEDVESFDLDDESKKAAQRLIEEAHELEMEGVESKKVEMPKNEYFFDNIHDDAEAVAFIKAWNKSNRIKGRIPTDHETILMKLSVMWADAQKGNKRNSKRK